jgi:hypothetical protein
LDQGAGRGATADELPARTWNGAEIPEDIRHAILDEVILDLGGVYGEPDAGDPIEYNHLKPVATDGAVEIEFFNRGITLFITGDEKFRRIHRFLCRLDRANGREA